MGQGLTDAVPTDRLGDRLVLQEQRRDRSDRGGGNIE